MDKNLEAVRRAQVEREQAGAAAQEADRQEHRRHQFELRHPHGS